MITNIQLFKESINKKYYHGSTKLFNKFSLNNEIKNSVYNGISDNNLGIFFTDNLTMAESFANVIEFDPNSGKYINSNNIGYVYEVNILTKNPYILQEHINNIDEDDATQTYFNLIEKYGGSNNFKKYLISNGYDSIIVHNCTANYYENDIYTIIVVFNPNDIKIINTIKYNV